MKRYLGDAVYADIDEFGRLVLTTEDGISVTNRIIFEPEVLGELLRDIEKRKKEACKHTRTEWDNSIRHADRCECNSFDGMDSQCLFIQIKRCLDCHKTLEEKP